MLSQLTCLVYRYPLITPLPESSLFCYFRFLTPNSLAAMPPQTPYRKVILLFLSWEDHRDGDECEEEMEQFKDFVRHYLFFNLHHCRIPTRGSDVACFNHVTKFISSTISKLGATHHYLMLIVYVGHG